MLLLRGGVCFAFSARGAFFRGGGAFVLTVAAGGGVSLAVAAGGGVVFCFCCRGAGNFVLLLLPGVCVCVFVFFAVVAFLQLLRGVLFLLLLSEVLFVFLLLLRGGLLFVLLLYFFGFCCRCQGGRGCFSLLSGPSAAVHSFTGLPGLQLLSTTTKKQQQQDKKHPVPTLIHS